jgi:hypothetical protein
MVVVDGDGAANPSLAYRELADAIGTKDDVLMLAPPRLNADGTGAMIMVVPSPAPAARTPVAGARNP